MRKLDTASSAEGLVRKESCNHEEVTAFYDTALQEEQINVGSSIDRASSALESQQFTSGSE